MNNSLTEFLPLSKLILLENNPRKITKNQFDKLCKSLEEDPSFLDARPILVNCKDNKYIVYGGNQRVQAAKKLGWDEILCHVEYDLSDKQINARILKDNKTYGEFDWDILANEYDDEDILNAGFTEIELSGKYDDDISEEVEKPKKTKLKTCPECGCKF